MDGNQAEIIAAIKASGGSVEIIRQPLDLLVGAGGRWGLLEVKASPAEERRKTPTRERQKRFADSHPYGGPVGVVWDVEGALRFVRLLRGEG